MISNILGDSESPLNGDRLPSLPALRCFEAAARLENFTRAASELHLTHGAISRAVRAIEDDLGVALFERRSRRVHLTDAGRKLAKAVREGFGLMQQATRELRADARRSQRWVLSCEPTLLMRWLIPRWPDFQARHPGADVHLVAGGGEFSFESGIDLAIRRDDFAWPDAFHNTLLFAEKVGPVCRPDKVSAWFAAGTAGIVLQPAAPRLHTRTRMSAWQEWSESAGHALMPASEPVFEHFYFSLQAAVAGLGVAMGPWHLVRDDIDSGVLVAPMGFIEDGSNYCVLAPAAIGEGTMQAGLLEWLRTIA